MLRLIKSGLRALLMVTLFNIDLFAFVLDDTLPVIKNLKVAVDRTSIGFEWNEIKDPRVEGINVYRAVAKAGVKQVFEKIATIRYRYSTHFVDYSIKPSTVYFYTFTTFVGIKESLHGKVIKVKSQPPFKSVDFKLAKRVDFGVVKLLWKPHPNPIVYEYMIQRKAPNKEWKYLATVKGRLVPEYIDTTATNGIAFKYRIIPRSVDGFVGLVSRELQVKPRW
ncbi:MAG: hypothetical protein GXO02_04580 [Epsilonproteobacteria bacterium]|nr:hypothetical protein [Campylobacterota bacterium]